MTTPRLFHRLRALLQPAPIFGTAIVAIFWMGLVFLLSFERTNASERASQQGSSLARLFEENTIRLFEKLLGRAFPIVAHRPGAGDQYPTVEKRSEHQALNNVNSRRRDVPLLRAPVPGG